MKTALKILLILTTLTACSKPPELQAPCKNFGKYCSQQTINED